MSDARLTAYNVKTKEKGVPIQDAVITKTAKGAYMAQEKWLEVSSVSNFETYQSNRMKVRFKDKDGKNQLVHTLNGSSLALPRILACLLENNQHEKGIQLPDVLHRYFGDSNIQ